MKTVFTTGEAAEICKVSQQTIIRCFDSGRLKGFRVPGSRFRRIPRERCSIHEGQRHPAGFAGQRQDQDPRRG
jgi:excisionase family DNA binding protein